MRSPRTRPARLLAALLALTLLAAACGDDGDGEAAGDTATGGGDASGNIEISGSSTVEPISALVAEQFQGQNPGVAISVEGPGTGDGFQRFCAGETAISDASRPISEEEIADCEASGVEFVELQVAIDGLSVITSPDGDTVADCLSFTDMYALVGPESQGIGTWADANDLAAELGGTVAAPFPDVPLTVVAPGEESGTYDSFVELVIEPIAEERGEDAQTRPDYQASADDNVIVQGIQGAEGSLGWVGYAFFEENQDALKAFDVTGDGSEGGCVAPTPETIASGEYPLSRPLFIYVNAGMAEQNEALQQFVDFYLSEEGIQAVSDAGYVSLEESALEETRQAWESRTTGAQQS